ncbi:hypothetical protein ACFV16_38430 [Streptomyces massasporeus]
MTQSMGPLGASTDSAACGSFHVSFKQEILQGARRFDGAAACRLLASG